MFGINSFEQVGQIVEGWTKAMVNIDQEMSNKRVAICKNCPLYDPSSILGAVCSSKKCYNPNTNELKQVPEQGFICGCGCVIDKASRVKNKKCVLNKWDY